MNVNKPIFGNMRVFGKPDEVRVFPRQVELLQRLVKQGGVENVLLRLVAANRQHVLRVVDAADIQAVLQVRD